MARAGVWHQGKGHMPCWLWPVLLHDLHYGDGIRCTCLSPIVIKWLLMRRYSVLSRLLFLCNVYGLEHSSSRNTRPSGK